MTVNSKDSKIFRVRPPKIDKIRAFPSNHELNEYVCEKYGSPDKMGPSPKLRYDLGYVSADDTYEALVSKLVRETTRWIDVGCGRDIFPSNYQGALALSQRAAFLVGVDPDDNVNENELLTERFQGTIEEFASNEKFDLVTMRMVAEHVRNAKECAEKLAELTSSGGLVVIYTPWKWAPMSMAASVIPFSLHNKLKRLIWDTDEKDTFPTAYKMNTRNDLRKLFNAVGFDEVLYARVDDCSVLTKFLTLNRFEIQIRGLLAKCRLAYPEFCLLSIFQRN